MCPRLTCLPKSLPRLPPVLLAALMAAMPAHADTRALPVPTVTLYPGDAIVPQVIVSKMFTGDAAGWTSYVVSLDQLQDKYARRTLVAGQPIAVGAVKGHDAVQRGVAAPAIYQSEGLTISTMLMPLQSGTAGDLIQARNVESGVVVRALVSADGSLIVGGE